MSWNKILNAVADGKMKAGKEQCFGVFMALWLSSIRQDVKASTLARYHFLLQYHIFPELGMIPLNRLDNVLLEEYVRKKRDTGSRDGGELAPKTVNCLISVIKQVLRFAEEEGCLDKPLKIRALRQNKPEIRIMTREEQRQLETMAAKDGGPAALGILVALYTGLRIGEVCALQWKDISLEYSVITVSRTISRIQEYRTREYGSRVKAARTRVVLSSPKTDSSRRMIPIADALKEFLMPYRSAPDCYLLTGKTNYIDPRTFYRKYRRFLEECGIGPYNYHALRHTFATRCVESGADIKSLSEILGHADVSVTLGRYVHPSMEQKKQTIEKMFLGMR